MLFFLHLKIILWYGRKHRRNERLRSRCAGKEVRVSVNYHAFQNRGYLFSNHEADADLWYEKYKNYNPERIAGILGLAYDDDYLYVPYYDLTYRLVRATGKLEKEKKETPKETDRKEHTRENTVQDRGKTWTDEIYFNEGMAVYHLLEYTKDAPRHAGIWVRTDALDGVVSRNPAVKDPLLIPFAAKFSGRCVELKKACESLGGREVKRGDVCYEFDAFPWLSLRLEFWDADEDFPAQASVLTDRYATDYVHYETLGCILSDLLEKLEEP